MHVLPHLIPCNAICQMFLQGALRVIIAGNPASLLAFLTVRVHWSQVGGGLWVLHFGSPELLKAGRSRQEHHGICFVVLLRLELRKWALGARRLHLCVCVLSWQSMKWDLGFVLINTKKHLCWPLLKFDQICVSCGSNRSLQARIPPPSHQLSSERTTWSILECRNTTPPMPHFRVSHVSKWTLLCEATGKTLFYFCIHLTVFRIKCIFILTLICILCIYVINLVCANNGLR